MAKEQAKQKAERNAKRTATKARIRRVEQHQRYYLILTDTHLVDNEKRTNDGKVRWATKLSDVVSAAIEPDWHGGVAKFVIQTASGETKTFKKVQLVKGLALGPGLSHVGQNPWAMMEQMVNQALMEAR